MTVELEAPNGESRENANNNNEKPEEHDLFRRENQLGEGSINKGGLFQNGTSGNFGEVRGAWTTLEKGQAEEFLQFTGVEVLVSSFHLSFLFQERHNSCNHRAG